MKSKAICLSITLFVLLAIVQNAQCHIGHRIALIIGNQSYRAGPLKNPINDANDMEKALRYCEFEVIKGTDVKRSEMQKICTPI